MISPETYQEYTDYLSFIIEDEYAINDTTSLLYDIASIPDAPIRHPELSNLRSEIDRSYIYNNSSFINIYANMDRIIVDLQNSIIQDYGDLNDFLSDNGIVVGYYFAQFSDRLGFSIDDSNVEYIILNSGSSYTVDGSVKIKFNLVDGYTTATVIVYGTSFIVKSLNDQFIWDFNGAGEHTFTTIGESILRFAGAGSFYITWQGYSSLLFSVGIAPIQPFFSHWPITIDVYESDPTGWARVKEIMLETKALGVSHAGVLVWSYADLSASFVAEYVAELRALGLKFAITDYGVWLDRTYYRYNFDGGGVGTFSFEETITSGAKTAIIFSVIDNGATGTIICDSSSFVNNDIITGSGGKTADINGTYTLASGLPIHDGVNHVTNGLDLRYFDTPSWEFDAASNSSATYYFNTPIGALLLGETVTSGAKSAIVSKIMDYANPSWGTIRLDNTTFANLDILTGVTSGATITITSRSGTAAGSYNYDDDYALDPSYDGTFWQDYLAKQAVVLDTFQFTNDDYYINDIEIWRRPEGWTGIEYKYYYDNASAGTFVIGETVTCGVQSAVIYKMATDSYGDNITVYTKAFVDNDAIVGSISLRTADIKGNASSITLNNGFSLPVPMVANSIRCGNSPTPNPTNDQAIAFENYNYHWQQRGFDLVNVTKNHAPLSHFLFYLEQSQEQFDLNKASYWPPGTGDFISPTFYTFDDTDALNTVVNDGVSDWTGAMATISFTYSRKSWRDFSPDFSYEAGKILKAAGFIGFYEYPGWSESAYNDMSYLWPAGYESFVTHYKAHLSAFFEGYND